MDEFENKWDAYLEQSIEKDRDPVKDDRLIYGVDVPHFTVTVYSPEGRVSKYWNARILEDLMGYCRIACPRDDKILNFNWVHWTAYMFTHDGLNELVFMPGSNRKTIFNLFRSEVK